jgi:hypothetical protein
VQRVVVSHPPTTVVLVLVLVLMLVEWVLALTTTLLLVAGARCNGQQQVAAGVLRVCISVAVLGDCHAWTRGTGWRIRATLCHLLNGVLTSEQQHQHQTRVGAPLAARPPPLLRLEGLAS